MNEFVDYFKKFGILLWWEGHQPHSLTQNMWRRTWTRVFSFHQWKHFATLCRKVHR